MTSQEFEQIIRISFERKKFTNLTIDKKLFKNFAHVYCKSAVHAGKFHYTCTMIDMRGKPTLEVRQADVNLAVWDDQDAPQKVLQHKRWIEGDSMFPLCILIFPIAVLFEAMKMNK